MSDSTVAKALRSFALSENPRVVLVRFLAVGGTLAVVYAGLSGVLHAGAGMPAAVASGVAYGFTIPPAYWCQRVLAFRSDAAHSRAFPRYVLLQAPLLALGALLSWLLLDVLHGPKVISFFVVAPAVAAVSFVAQRVWTFAKG
jgi:putative flippase GtrA